MCNCGKKRNTIAQPLSGNVVMEGSSTKMWPDVNFEYTGKSGLSVTGSITGKRYRFNHPGDVQLISYRDVSGMAAVPHLRKIMIKE
ncbi:MAG: hypothetical protein ABI237_14125 [Ginsengibacter sp.]